MKTVQASAPGKILFLGGYSVLEQGCSALALSVDARVRVRVKPRKDNFIAINAKGFGEERGVLKNGGVAWTRVPKLVFLKSVVENCLAFAKSTGLNASGFELSARNDKAFGKPSEKSGLGSSAAVTVASAAALLNSMDCDDVDTIHKIAQYSHSIAQGRVGSGFDVAAACFGSCVYQRFSPRLVEENDVVKAADVEWDFVVQKPVLPQLFLSFASFKKSSASTPLLVKKVFAWKEKNAGVYSDLINELNQVNLRALNAWGFHDWRAFKAFVDEGRRVTGILCEKAGAAFEPPQAKALIEQAYDGGAIACKLPGAGGLDAIAALSPSFEAKKSIDAVWKKNKGLKVMPVGLDDKGLEVE